MSRVLVRADVLFWAFRYALGRRTYAVSDVAEELAAVADRLPRPMREMIIREISECNDLGHHCDREAWAMVVRAMQRPELLAGAKERLTAIARAAEFPMGGSAMPFSHSDGSDPLHPPLPHGEG